MSSQSFGSTSGHGSSGVGGLEYTNPANTSNVAAEADQFFKAIGVNLSGSNAPGRGIAYNDKLGTLFVRATPGELDTVERVFQTLNQAPPQTDIKTKFTGVGQNGSTTELATQIVPLRFVDRQKWLTKLAPSLSPQATVVANEAGNSIVITDTPAEPQAPGEIINSLDVPPRRRPHQRARSPAGISDARKCVLHVLDERQRRVVQARPGQFAKGPDAGRGVHPQRGIHQRLQLSRPGGGGGPAAGVRVRARARSVRAEPRLAAVLRQDGGGGTAGGPRVEPGFAAGHVRLDGARRPRGHHPRGVARAGGAIAAAGHGERGHLRAHGAAVGGRRERRQGRRDAGQGRRHHAATAARISKKP